MPRVAFFEEGPIGCRHDSERLIDRWIKARAPAEKSAINQGGASQLSAPGHVCIGLPAMQLWPHECRADKAVRLGRRRLFIVSYPFRCRGDFVWYGMPQQSRWIAFA